ncbi:MAG: hypothetical protein GPJ50_02485 [Candidatus Heimdallarchaeota archaeon]|nr:hypothetical protein [Candidatus Heimdallarchaeota archaeon]
MGLFPDKMLEATIITPKELFPQVVIKIAETESLMVKHNISIKGLEDFYPSSKMEKIRQLESAYKDFVIQIPEPKEKFRQKIARAYKKQKTIIPIFENWENLEEIETKLEDQIDKLNSEIQNLKNNLKKLIELCENSKLISKGIRLLEEERPYDIDSDEKALMGILTTSKIEDAEDFVSHFKKHEVIPLVKDRYFVYTKGKKGEISKLIKELSIIRWHIYDYQGPIHLNRTEIEEEILNEYKNTCAEVSIIENNLEQFAIRHKEDIVAIKLSIESYSHFLRIYVSAKQTKKTTVFQGWVSEKEVGIIEEAIGEFPEVILEYDEPSEDMKNIPVVPAKKPLRRAFQSIVGLYGLPSSNEVDPTIFLIFTFSIFFGIMFGDVGHGLIFAVIGLTGVLARGLKRSIRQMFLLVLVMGITSTIMGFIFGEAFGVHLVELLGIREPGDHSPVYLFGIEYPFLSPVEDLVEIFNLTLIIGALHVILGILLRAINQIKRKEYAEIIEETTPQVFLYAAIIYFLSSLGILDIGIDPSGKGFLLVGLVSVIIGVGLTLFGQGIVGILFKEKRKNILRSFLSGMGMGLIHLLESFSSFISNTISYGRMLAMLIAHAVFLSVINALAEQVGFILFKIVILVIGNIFVLALEGLLVFVQTLRLHFYEFFSKFYEGSGIQHKPIFVFNKEMDLSKYGN